MRMDVCRENFNNPFKYLLFKKIFHDLYLIERLIIVSWSGKVVIWDEEKITSYYGIRFNQITPKELCLCVCDSISIFTQDTFI